MPRARQNYCLEVKEFKSTISFIYFKSQYYTQTLAKWTNKIEISLQPLQVPCSNLNMNIDERRKFQKYHSVKPIEPGLIVYGKS